MSRNRKAIANGEIPSEMWRLLTNPEWVRAGFRVKVGLGGDLNFGDMAKPQNLLRQLFGTMLYKSTLPVQSIVNKTVGIPKKIVAEME